MIKYKGYYIDKVCFHNKAEIDEFVKKQAVEKFELLNKLFDRDATMEACVLCTKQARLLHDEFGFSWGEIEEMEMKAVS